MNNVSYSVDSFIAVNADLNPFWTIILEDGRTIYQDDDRPGLEEKSAWIRARNHIHELDLEVNVVKFRFAGYEHIVYDSSKDTLCDGFYFSKGRSALLSYENSRSWDFYTAGKVYGDQMYVERYEIPFLEKIDCITRDVRQKNIKSIIVKREKRLHFSKYWERYN